MFVFVVFMFYYFFYSLFIDVMVIVFKVGARIEKGWLFFFSMYFFMGFEVEKNKIFEVFVSLEDVYKFYWYGII